MKRRLAHHAAEQTLDKEEQKLMAQESSVRLKEKAPLEPAARAAVEDAIAVREQAVSIRSAALEQRRQALAPEGTARDDGIPAPVLPLTPLPTTPTELAAAVENTLREPLALVESAAEALANGELAPRDARAAERVKRGVARMRRSLERLKRFSRPPRSRRATMRRVRIDLVRLCQDVTTSITNSHPEASIALRAPEHLHADVDPDALDEVFTNMAVNALQHGSSSGVQMSLSDDGAHFTFMVRGEATAAPEAGAESGGVGLGLMMVQRVAAAHGGGFSVEADVTGGMQACFTAPLHHGRNRRMLSPARLRFLRASLNLEKRAAGELDALAFDGQGWRAAGDGVELRRVESSLVPSAAEVLIVRIQDGATYESRLHTGDEQLLVLQGALREAGGREVWCGERVVYPEGVQRRSCAFGGVPCVALVVVGRG